MSIRFLLNSKISVSLLCFAVLSAVVLPSRAYGFVESYSLFGPLESKDLNGPDRIDGEYYSDILAFRNSFTSDYRFLNATNAYDIYAGSVSSTQFAIQQRLKLNEKITEKLYFDLVYIEKENLEEGREQFLSGLTYQFSNFLSASAYTSLFSNKDQNDVGFAVTMNLTPAHKLRLFMNMVDFGFNERNQFEGEDQKKPLHFGLYGQWISDQFKFLEYYFYQNSSVVRDFTQTDERYIFKETRLGARGKLKISKSYDYNFDLDVFDGEEGRFLLSTSDPENDIVWSRNGLRFLNQFESGFFRLGVEYNYRHWSSDQGNVQHSNIMPHMWYNMRLRDSTFLPSSIDFGLETSFHEAQGPVALRSSTDADSDINGRFNMRLFYEFSKTAVLNLLLSADLDDDFSWEGGAGQFQIQF